MIEDRWLCVIVCLGILAPHNTVVRILIGMHLAIACIRLIGDDWE